MTTYYLVMVDGTKSEPTKDLYSLFDKARAINAGQLIPQTAAIFRSGSPPVCLATFGAFRMSQGGKMKRIPQELSPIPEAEIIEEAFSEVEDL